MLVQIEVKFLDRVYHGRKSARHAEWPPSPFRLYQAMLAGSGAAAEPVLRWLETCDPPRIVAPDIQGTYGRIVPGLHNGGNRNNTIPTQAYADGSRLYTDCIACRSLRTTIRQVMDGDTLKYLYKVDSIPMGLEAVEGIVKRIQRLGCSNDWVMCSCSVVDAITDRDNLWVPGYRGTTLRVPTAGSYDSLASAFEAGLHYGNGRFLTPVHDIRFKERSYGKHSANQYIVFRLVSPTSNRMVSVAPWRSCDVAAWVRHALIAAARTTRHEFCGGSDLYVAGHCHANGRRLYDAEVPRLAYIPLPSIAGPYSDCQIRRVMVAGCGDVNHADSIEWVRQALSGIVLTDDDGVAVAALAEDDVASSSRYVGDSDSWFSVTPVVLPGFDRGESTTEELVKRVLRYANAGDVKFELSSSVCGMPLRYKMPLKMGRRPTKFLRLRFNKRVSGPITLGIGRYCGLGVFARG